MTTEDVAQIVLDLLEQQQIQYMLVGSLAGNLHGVPRATNDADIVFDCSKLALEQFMLQLHDGFYADLPMAIDALKSRFMFNIIHHQSGIKVDLIVRKLRDFDIAEFERRIQMMFRGYKRWVITPEGLILTKLEWCKLSDSERQFNDALNVAQIQNTRLDVSYLRKWAKELEVEDLLGKLLEQKK